LRLPVVTVAVSDEMANERLMSTDSHLRSTGWLAEGLRLGTAVCRGVGLPMRRQRGAHQQPCDSFA
jgi:hypothetical protein